MAESECSRMEEGDEDRVSMPYYSGHPVGQQDERLSCGQFIFVIDTLAHANAWSEQQTLHRVIHCLTGPALEWAKSIEIKSYQEFKPIMHNHFAAKLNIKEKIELRKSLTQKPSENVQQFFERCKKVQGLICDHFVIEVLYERDILINFLLGLKKEIRDIVIKSESTSLISFVEAAIKVENVQESMKAEEFDNGFEAEPVTGLFEEALGDLSANAFSDDEEDKPLIQRLIKSEFKDEEHGGPFACHQCGFSYVIEKFLFSHVQGEHAPDRCRVKCDGCEVTFHTRRMFHLHMQNSHKEMCHECHECLQIFYSPLKLSAHYSMKHSNQGSSELQCNFCNKAYSNKNSLKAHIHLKHVNEKVFACQVCPKTFSSPSNLKTHIRIVHLMERPYECSDCGKSYASEGGLLAHQSSIHGKGDRLKCDMCDMTFPYKSALTTHILNRHNRGTFICDECGMSHNTKESLRVHKITDHSEDKGKRLPCTHPGCKERFRVPFQVRNHVLRVHKKVEGTHVCGFCNKKYHSKQRLESHINGVHLHKKPHKCPHCEFASAYRGHIKDHVRASHESVKYPCPYPLCVHQSSYKGNLDKHIKNIHGKNPLVATKILDE
jgi:hypothetical protein